MVVKIFSSAIKVVFLVLVLAIFTFGCGSSEPKDDNASIKLPGGNSISLDKEAGAVKISGKGGDFEIQSSEAGVIYPAVLEHEFPPCPGCKPVQVTNIGGITSVVLKSGGSAEEASEFFLKKAKAAGYKVGTNTQAAGMIMFTAEKDGKSFTCQAGVRDDGATMVNIRYHGGQ